MRRDWGKKVEHAMISPSEAPLSMCGVFKAGARATISIIQKYKKL